MTIKKKNLKNKTKLDQEKKTLKSEEAMIHGIVEGSPDAAGVAVIRLDCGCRKMAAVDREGEPASKVIIYRDSSQSVCDKCKKDNGAFIRVKEEFIHWLDSEITEETKQLIISKVLGTQVSH